MRCILWLTLISVLLSCRGEPGALAAGFETDTLAGGVVRARNGALGLWARTGQAAWTLAEDLRIGRAEGGGPEVFEQVQNVIPGTGGSIWVLDAGAHALRQFGPGGASLQTVGREGQGSGEFGSNPCAFPGPDGEIWVESGGRWQRFSAAGKLLGGQPETRSMGCAIVAWRGDEMAAADLVYDRVTRGLSSALILYNRLPDGTVVPRDTMPFPKVPEGPTVNWSKGGRVIVTYPLPLAPSPGYFLQRSGVFWVTDGGGAYRFRRQTLEGDTLLIVERAYKPIAVPDSIRHVVIRRLRLNDRLGYPDDFNPSEVPRVFPPFERIAESDDGTIWLRRRVQGGRAAYDVFGRNGEFLGTVPLPPNFSTFIAHSITADHIYGVVRDALDVQYVVRLRIDK